MTLGEAIKRARAAKGLSGNMATKELEVSRATFDGWETGFRQPAAEHWQKIADFIGVDRVEIALMLGVISQDELRRRCAEETLRSGTTRPSVASRRRPAKIA